MASSAPRASAPVLPLLLILAAAAVSAALLCIPLRGNIPIAALMTFLSNPATTPFILLASLEVGSILGFRTDVASFNTLRESGASFGEWFGWLFSDAAPAIVTGLFIIAAAAGLIGYLFTVLFWRWWQGKKWRRRARRPRGSI